MAALPPDVEGAVLLDVRPERCGPLSGLEAALVALAVLGVCLNAAMEVVERRLLNIWRGR